MFSYGSAPSKFAPYEADSIAPLVADGPFLSFFYKHPDQYRTHLTQEGEFRQAERAWQTENNTYRFSTVLGSVELLIGLLTLVGVALRGLGLLGASLAFITSFITILFLITTPDAWVPALGDAQHGFPYLSGGGRLVMKDVLLLAGAWLIMTDSAKSLLAVHPSGTSDLERIRHFIGL